MTNVHQFTGGRMTDAQYEKERTELRETYGDNRRQAGVRWEQELAKLFARTGWTTEELAAKEGKTYNFVMKQLRFGRFLNFGTTVPNVESLLSNLPERRFRRYWQRTCDGSGTRKSYNERQRFTEVQRLLVEESDVVLRQKNKLQRGSITR
jgi:hypothetical protein